MLFWHKHDLERAMQDLANFTPFPDEWSVEDKVLFEQAFQVFKAQSFFMIMWFLYVRPDYLIYSRTFFMIYVIIRHSLCCLVKFMAIIIIKYLFQFHGKSFHRIRQMLPDKSIAALVKYYYSWKKTRTRLVDVSWNLDFSCTGMRYNHRELGNVEVQFCLSLQPTDLIFSWPDNCMFSIRIQLSLNIKGEEDVPVFETILLNA